MNKSMYSRADDVPIQYYELCDDGESFNKINCSVRVERALRPFTDTFGKYLSCIVYENYDDGVRLSHSIDSFLCAEFKHSYACKDFPIDDFNKFITKVEMSYRGTISALLDLTDCSNTKDGLRNLTYIMDAFKHDVGGQLLDNPYVTNSICGLLDHHRFTFKEVYMCEGLLLDDFTSIIDCEKTHHFTVDESNDSRYIVIGNIIVKIIDVQLITDLERRYVDVELLNVITHIRHSDVPSVINTKWIRRK